MPITLPFEMPLYLDLAFLLMDQNRRCSHHTSPARLFKPGLAPQTPLRQYSYFDFNTSHPYAGPCLMLNPAIACPLDAKRRQKHLAHPACIFP
jgi:hypothetical protein